MGVWCGPSGPSEWTHLSPCPAGVWAAEPLPRNGSDPQVPWFSPKVPVSDWGQLDLTTIPNGTQRPGTRLRLMRPCGASAPSSSQGYYQGLEGIRVQLLWQPSPASSLFPICDLESALTPKISISECFQKPGPSWTLVTTAYASCSLCSFLS